jgi:3'-5' exoribonuclease
MEKRLYIDQIAAGQQVQDLFLVSRKNLMETKNGKPYLALGLMDRSGEMEARVWDNATALDAVAEVGRVVLVTAVAKSYRDQVQLTVSHLDAAGEGEARPEDFMPASERSTAAMRDELFGLIESFTDRPLQTLLRAVFQESVVASFLRAPAAKKMHHAYVGGLAEHTLSLAGLAQKICAHYPSLDRDLLLAGTLLHDLAKIVEFEYAAPPFDYTDKGRLLGHIVLGTEMIRQAAAAVPDLSEERLDALTHLVLSHHGRLEFGSPVLPMTPEAILFHHLDDMDAKMNFMQQLAATLPGPGWQWTDFQRPLERFLYLQGPDPDGRGDAAGPAEPEEKAGRRYDPRDFERRQQSLF